jgi:membrane protease YdiL (CAAX protease family)
MQDERFPSAWQALLLVLCLFMAQYVVGAALYDARRLLDLSEAELSILDTLLGNGIIFVILMHAKKFTYRKLFHPSRASIASTSMLVVPLVVLLIPFLILVAGEMNAVLVRLFPMSRSEERMFDQMIYGGFASVLTGCVLAPSWRRCCSAASSCGPSSRSTRAGAPIVGSAIIFGLAHLNLYQFMVALITGFVLGWLYERTRSLVPCIALHALFNASTFALAAFESPDESGASAAAGVWIAASLMAVVGGPR